MPVRRLALVVDDDAHIREFMRAVLERDGFEVLAAAGGIAALALVGSLHRDLDVIVTDIQMPEGDGLTFAREVRRRFAQIPILLVSGRSQSGGEFSFLEKPFSSAELSAWVRRFTEAEAKRGLEQDRPGGRSYSKRRAVVGSIPVARFAGI